MTVPVTKTFSIRQGNTGTFTCVLKHLGAVIPVATVNQLTLTLTDVATGAIINSRNAQDVLNTNGVTLDANGRLTWLVTAQDTALVADTTRKLRATFYVLFDDGSEQATINVGIRVKDVEDV